MTCARCGAQNPDGNAFCQACGSALAAVAAQAAPVPPSPGPPPGPPPGVTGPPAGMPPPVFAGPTGYASPYYTPQGPTAPVHRTPWMVIVAGVLALIVLMAGCGTALAVLANHNGTASLSGSIGDVPSPTPATSPSPIASPTTTPNAPGVESNDGLSVTLPPGWTVDSKDSESMVLFDPDTQGDVTLASGASLPAASAQDNMNEIVSGLKSRYPDTRACPNTKTTSSTFSGVKGLSFSLCFTLTSGSNSLPAAASVFVGANESGSVYYLVMVLTRQENLNAYVAIAKPVLASVHWKLS